MDPRGWDLIYDEGQQRKESDYDLTAKLAFRLVHAGEANALSVASRERVLMRGRWNHVLAVYDGSGKASGVRIYVDGKPIPVDVDRDALRGTLRVTTPLELRPAVSGCACGARVALPGFPDLSPRIVGAGGAPAGLRGPRGRDRAQAALAVERAGIQVRIGFLFLRITIRPCRSLVQQFAALGVQLEELSKGGEPAMVSEESPRLAYADVLTRGNFAQRAEKVRPGVPHFLPPMPKDAPKDRRGLAEWVVSAKNPLTARVSVNRMWQEIFGTGLVETTENFGTAGRAAFPSRTARLAGGRLPRERLGREAFLQAARDVRHLSAVSQATLRPLEKDPTNRLLSHGPRFRMDAEMLRDTALAVSGLLVEKIGGPSVKPYQSAGRVGGGKLSRQRYARIRPGSR